MKKKFPLSYRTIQKIKAEEYERFFSGLPDYFLYMNHLGEIRWMTEEEALNQHEFFYYSESMLERWKRRIRLRRKITLPKLSEAEKELRLHCRRHLEKKYLGETQPETRAALPEEWKYEIEEEEIEPIPLTLDLGSEGIWKKLFLTVGILAAISIISYFWVSRNINPLVGKLLVTTEIAGARIYLDETDFIGYSNKTIVNIPAGQHRITAYKEGYVALPKYHEVEIVQDSLVTLNFVFNQARSEVQGYLKIDAEQKASKIFVDNLYYGQIGEDSILTLEEGQHNINIQMPGYMTVPAEKVISITAGDTSFLVVDQVAVPRRGSRISSGSREGTGSIQVSSDIKGARILLNGEDTGNETDYVFTKLPRGSYTIQLRKEGYTVEPEETQVTISRNNQIESLDFHLIRNFEKVRIETDPATGPIYVDGEFKGEGKFEGVLKIGGHSATFGDINDYKTPEPVNFDVKPGSPVNLQINYFPVLNIVAAVNNNGNIFTNGCEAQGGYTFSNRAFTASDEGGPSVEFNEKLQEYVWKLGYAFPYRNPKGNDALKVSFNLPRNMKSGRKFKLRLIAAASKDKYPLSFSTKVDILVKFNNTKLSYYYEPKFLEDIGGLEVTEWDISQYVKPGDNILEISTTEDNNIFYYVKRIEIFN